jgi:hypothetical protein
LDQAEAVEVEGELGGEEGEGGEAPEAGLGGDAYCGDQEERGGG